jgi:hypothetical protein
MVIVDELYHNVVITLPQLKLIEFIMKLKEAKANVLKKLGINHYHRFVNFLPGVL